MLEVHRLEVAHLEDLAQVFCQTFREKPWQEVWSKEEAKEALLEGLSYPRSYGLVAVDGEKVLGGLLGNVRPYAGGTKTFYLEQFFVHPYYHHQGIGRALYQQAVRDLKREEVSGFFYTSLRQTAADLFYREQGAFVLKDSQVYYHSFM